MPISLESLAADPAQLLDIPEDQWFERKGIGTSSRDIAKTLVAFANAEGGTLAVGASRQTGLGGIRANPRRVNDVRQAALNLTDPPVRHTVQLVSCRNPQGEADEVLLLEVEPSEQMHRLTDGSAWLRVGDTTRELDHEQALQLSYDKGISHFDSEVAPTATLDDLEGDEVERYRSILGSRLRREDVLTARGLYRDRGPGAGVTWAGILLFGHQPSQFYANAYVRVIRYQGSRPQTGARMNVLQDEIVEGAIPVVIERTKAFLPQFMATFSRLAVSGRFERISEYPEAAWLEAIVNALTHRSYALLGDHIRVKLFDDRLEVESPGRLPGLVRPDNIRSTRYSRNPRIARVLAKLGYVRELGEGVDRMFDEMASLGLPPPEFRQDPASVTVTLYNNRTERQQRLFADVVPGPMVPVIDALVARRRLTTSETATLLGVSRQTATRYLAHLRDLGLIERVGSGAQDPTAFWRLRRVLVAEEE